MSISRDGISYAKKTNFHLIPGRLRIGVPGLLNNPNLANAIAHRFVSFLGVKSFRVNPITGQVLVYFDHHKTDLGLLIPLILNIKDQQDLIPSDELTGQHNPDLNPPKNETRMSWHVLDGSEALAITKSSLETGLSQNVALNRLRIYGPNELRASQKISFWKIALMSLNGFMTKLLLVAGGVSLLIGKTTDAGVIGAIVVVQAIVEAAQSCRAEKSLDRLKELSDPLTTVLREGKISKIPSKELVPGDILSLSAGDMVPADARIIEESGLLTNEACLTGESIPVVKDNRKSEGFSTPITDQANMLFTGTSIIGGRATAVVVTTGMRTELGRIARLLGEVKTEKTSLQKQLDHIGKKITHAVVVSVGAIAVIFLARGRSVLEVLRTGISLAVGAVPEGLPAVLTVALSTGIQRMVKRNAIVRNMSAVETLGSTTVICADKTGTLTKNEMTVKQLYIDNNFYDVSGYGYKPIGKIMLKGRENQEGNISLVREILKASVLCNNAELRPSAKGQWVVIGDPTEGALLTAAAKVGIWWHDSRNKFRRQQEIAFDTKRRIMTVICREFGDKQGVYVKGAPDAVINHCNTVIQDNKVKSLDSEIRKKILDSSESMAGEALRVLAIAYKILPEESNLSREDLESELTFCGLIGMSDSPREGVKEAIDKCRNAGVKVIMITGDHRKTAEAIASRLGILNRGKSITGKELDNIPDTEFPQKVEDFVVYSRTTPEQKLRIVRALKNRGQIVAMTGDGVNDAPAIKEADIGIAMGLSGTDVTREVAGMVLSDDNFVTIVNGIEEGRTVGMNLSKSLRYILSGSVGQLVMVFSSAALGLPAPLLPTQILWINLVTESLPAMALTADPPEGNYMNQPPLSPKGRFLPYQGRTILQKGVLFGICTFGLFSYGLMKGKWSLDKARTMAFSQLVINRIFNLINERKTAASKLQSVGKNPLILPAAATTVLMLAATMYLPFLSPLFSAVPIGLKDWGLLVTHAFMADQMDSLVEKRLKQSKSPKARTIPQN